MNCASSQWEHGSAFTVLWGFDVNQRNIFEKENEKTLHVSPHFLCSGTEAGLQAYTQKCTGRTVFYNFHHFPSMQVRQTSMQTVNWDVLPWWWCIYIGYNSPAGSFHPRNDVQNIRKLLLWLRMVNGCSSHTAGRRAHILFT